MVGISRRLGMKATRVAGALILVMGVSGCLSGGLGFGDGELKNSPIFSNTKTAPSEGLIQNLGVMDGTVVIAAPAGYCVDATSINDGSGRAFVPLGACSAMTKNPADPTPKVTAFLTASVLPLPVSSPNVPSDPKARMQAAKAFVESDVGRGALSRSGAKMPVTLLDIRPSSDVLFVRVKDGSAGLPSSLSDTNWRAFFEQNGVLVTATVNTFKERSYKSNDGFRLLTEFVSAIQKENSGSGRGSGG
ncbi:hypothetical protein [Aliiroseovarius sp. 2305UL8-7]|uniref:hypothetical protein n=1 Tax=Aliiroseovarius conchicola TaxID=3121637 RepID=UPI003528696D